MVVTQLISIHINHSQNKSTFTYFSDLGGDDGDRICIKYLHLYLQVKLLMLEYKEETDKVLDFKEFTVSQRCCQRY